MVWRLRDIISYMASFILTEDKVIVETSTGTPRTSHLNEPQQAATSLGGHFRIFDLPRELRDNIYDHALVQTTKLKLESKKTPRIDEVFERETLPNPVVAMGGVTTPASLIALHRPALHATIMFRPSMNIMLVSRQIKKEYEERAKRVTTLVLRDHHEYDFQPIELPSAAKKVQAVELRLIMFCHMCPYAIHTNDQNCHAAGELAQHQKWITALLPQVTQPHSLEIHAHICHDKYKSGKKERPPCEPIVHKKLRELETLEGLKYLALYEYEYAQNQELTGPKEMVYERAIPLPPVVARAWTAKSVESERSVPKGDDDEDDSETKVPSLR
ncbi:hypothetical protein LTR37_003504 [Vermiconidia calcicola]|uniref:Uncharacterized protein n=1 Tax=Vermiconidia calcicola TaxID=1690605 RepID=A0ACC3NPL4_9PEZI|nr:hypothetical protein LTR37_003504 [Vermiconidia calcicola]